MPALVHHSLTDAPEIFLTVVSTFGVGFLLWFLVGLLREERRTRGRQAPSLVFTGVRVLKFEPRDHQGAHAAPTVRAIKVPGEAGRVQVFGAPGQRSPKDTVKMRWLLMGVLLTATVRGFQTPPDQVRFLPAPESLVEPATGWGATATARLRALL